MNINSIIKTAKVCAAGVTILSGFGLAITNYKLHASKDEQIGALLKVTKSHVYEIEELRNRLDKYEARCICTAVGEKE